MLGGLVAGVAQVIRAPRERQRLLDRAPRVVAVDDRGLVEDREAHGNSAVFNGLLGWSRTRLRRSLSAPFSADRLAVPVQCSRPLRDARAENLPLDVGDALSRAANGHLIAVDQDAAIGRRATDVPGEVFDTGPARWRALHVAVGFAHATGGCGLRTRRWSRADGANRRQHNDQPCYRSPTHPAFRRPVRSRRCWFAVLRVFSIRR